MKKNFKNTFGVNGTPQQIEAFKEFAAGIGWKYEMVNPKGCYLSFNGDCEIAPSTFFTAVHLGGPIYTLPAQWAEAMQAASEEVEEPKRNVFSHYCNMYNKGMREMRHTLDECIKRRQINDLAVVKFSVLHEDGIVTKRHVELVHNYTEPVTL